MGIGANDDHRDSPAQTASWTGLTGAVAIGSGGYHSLAVQQVTPQVNLSLTPGSQTVAVGNPFTVTIRVTPQGGQQLVGVDAFVNFNPAVFQVDSIVQASTVLPVEMNNAFDNTAGYADFSAARLSGIMPSAAFDMAVITFHAIGAATNSPLTFNTEAPRKTDSGYDGSSVLGALSGATVTVLQPPAANFTAAGASSGTTTVAAGETVNFTDTSTESPTAWAWDFENNGSTDSTSQNPTHVYTVAGTYSMKLTATNLAGSGNTTKTNYITVVPGPTAPH